MININKPEEGFKEYFISILKKIKVDYLIDYDSTNTANYTLLLGSVCGRVQLEFNDNLDGDRIFYQTWVTLGEENYEIYCNQCYEDKDWNSIESNIEELITTAKNFARAKNKINSLFDEVREIIDQYNLDIDFRETAESIM